MAADEGAAGEPAAIRQPARRAAARAPVNRLPGRPREREDGQLKVAARYIEYKSAKEQFNALPDELKTEQAKYFFPLYGQHHLNSGSQKEGETAALGLLLVEGVQNLATQCLSRQSCPSGADERAALNVLSTLVGGSVSEKTESDFGSVSYRRAAGRLTGIGRNAIKRGARTWKERAEALLPDADPEDFPLLPLAIHPRKPRANRFLHNEQIVSSIEETVIENSTCLPNTPTMANAQRAEHVSYLGNATGIEMWEGWRVKHESTAREPPRECTVCNLHAEVSQYADLDDIPFSLAKALTGRCACLMPLPGYSIFVRCLARLPWFKRRSLNAQKNICACPYHVGGK